MLFLRGIELFALVSIFLFRLRIGFFFSLFLSLSSENDDDDYDDGTYNLLISSDRVSCPRRTNWVRPGRFLCHWRPFLSNWASMGDNVRFCRFLGGIFLFLLWMLSIPYYILRLQFTCCLFEYWLNFTYRLR